MRRFVSVVGATMLIVILAAPARAGTEPAYFYPDVDGWPSASLKTTSPSYSGPMLDIDGNGKQGRRVDKSDKGLAETDSGKYHQWSVGATGLEVTGAATLTIWFADKDFKDGDTNRIVAYLLDCGSSGCTTLAIASKDVSPPDGENVFDQTTLTFPNFTHTFASGRSLRVRVMIDKDFSNDDMTFAYDTTNYVTRLKLNKVLPPPTTTTTSSTTTTTMATTTTTGPTTTTTKAITTTSKASSTTTTAATTTTSKATTTTTILGTETTASVSTSTTLGETTSTTEQQAAAPGPSTTVPGPPPPPEQQDLDTEKTNLVVRTTPAQRGIPIASSSVKLSPVEGMMVTFVTAAETVRDNLLASVGLGLLMATLLIVGMSRRDEEAPAAPAGES